jgi:hypothetical protein
MLRRLLLVMGPLLIVVDCAKPSSGLAFSKECDRGRSSLPEFRLLKGVARYLMFRSHPQDRNVAPKVR